MDLDESLNCPQVAGKPTEGSWSQRKYVEEINNVKIFLTKIKAIIELKLDSKVCRSVQCKCLICWVHMEQSPGPRAGRWGKKNTN